MTIIRRGHKKTRWPLLKCVVAGFTVVILTLQGKILQKIFYKASEDNEKVVWNEAVYREDETSSKFVYPPQQPHNSKYSVDILSIASLMQLDLAEAQRTTWATHVTARFFWNATELDDPDPNCYTTENAPTLIEQVVNTCSKAKDPSWKDLQDAQKPLRQHFSDSFAKEEWLKKKANPVGWLCAQKRPAASLAKLGRTYRAGLQLQTLTLPDYLLVVDDDTYVNLEIFENTVLEPQHHFNSTSVVPVVVFAGCLIRWPAHIYNWTFPYGGFGTFWSKAALERFIRPLHCRQPKHEVKDDFFEKRVCQRIQENLLGERHLFKQGMSVSDLMGAMSAQNPYCLHSDWSQGYFVNYYFLSSLEEGKTDVPNARFHPLDGSEIVRRGAVKVKPASANCIFNEGFKCKTFSQTCHRMNRSQMHNLTLEVKRQYPGKFKK